MTKPTPTPETPPAIPPLPPAAGSATWTRQQEHAEMIRETPFEREDFCGGCGMLRSQCDCWDPVNQP
jgi:hypothetical protein